MTSILIIFVVALSLSLLAAIWLRKRNRVKPFSEGIVDQRDIVNPPDLKPVAGRMPLKERTADLLCTDDGEHMLANDESEEVDMMRSR